MEKDQSGDSSHRTNGHDSRTRLRDRDHFYRDVNPLLDEHRAAGTSLVLLVIDVAGPDFVLRTFGPAKRDGLLRDIGLRIHETVSAGHRPYHITQDRFAVVAPGDTYHHAARLAESLSQALRKPFDVSGVAYHLKAHIGISHFPNHADDIDELVRTAVFACHQARVQENDHATFDRPQDEQARHRFRLLIDLEQALQEHKDIRFAYQPLIDLQSGDCVGAEGLCRWHHPELGFIPPGHFLPLVEQTALMMPLTEALLALGLQDLGGWRDQGFHGSLAFNLSPSLLHSTHMLQRLVDQFRFADISMDQMHFEITETGIMDHPEQAGNVLGALRDHGCRLAVDDFGTGHSSLAYLADLPVDIIKIDRHFIQNLDHPRGRTIVSAATSIARSLGLTTVAEGIETRQQLRQCRELGLDVGQGFHIARPMFREAFNDWQARH